VIGRDYIFQIPRFPLPAQPSPSPSPSSPRSCPPPSTPPLRQTTPLPPIPAPVTLPALSLQLTLWTRTSYPPRPHLEPPAPSVHPNPLFIGGVIRTGLSSATTAVCSPRTPRVSLPYLQLSSSLQHFQPEDTSNASPHRSFLLPQTHYRASCVRETDAQTGDPYPRCLSIAQTTTRRHMPW